MTGTSCQAPGFGPSRLRRLALIFTALWWVSCADEADKEAPKDAADIQVPPQEPPLVVGLLPVLPVHDLELRFGLVLKRLQARSEIPLQMRTARTFEKFEALLQAESFDIALIQPIDFVRLPPDTYEPLARVETNLSAVLVSREDAQIDSILQLKGKALALPPPHAAVSYLARDALIAAGLMPGRDVSMRYQRNHAACIQAVAARSADACATTDLPLQRLSEQLKVSFHAGIRTREIPHIVWVAHLRVSARRRARLREALLNFANTNAGREMLSAAQLPAFVPASAHEYDTVRELLERAPPGAESP